MFIFKFLGLKSFISLVVVGGVVVVGAAGLYVAVIGGVDVPVLSDAFRVEVEPPSPEVIARADKVEQGIKDAIENKSAFFLELTDQNLSDLLIAELGTDDRIQNLKVEIRPEDVKVSGELAGRVGVGFSGVIGITLDQGSVELELKSVNLSSLPTPGFVKDEVQPFIDEVLDINERLRESGATQIQAVNLIPGVIQIVGVQAAGATVADSTVAAIRAAVGSGPQTPPTPPGGSTVPVGNSIEKPGAPLYLALGDSLAANVGVEGNEEAGYVSRFHGFLESKSGGSFGLRNLGISGESTISIRNGTQLSEALAVLRGSTPVSVLTLDLGANDVLAHLGSDDCVGHPDGLDSAPCQARSSAALDAFSPNFRAILQELAGALPAGAEFYVMTVYNPFDMGVGLPLETETNRVVGELNTLIRAEAEAVGAIVADPFPLMAGNAASWTKMLSDADIHPNEDGYQVLAHSLAVASGG